MFKHTILAIVLLVAGFLNVEHVAECAQQFKRCYNTSEEETHCFDVQYDNTTDQPLSTSFQNAQKRCKDIDSTLVIIENEEIDNLIQQQFMYDVNNPVRSQYFWLNALQVSDYSNPYRWHWLNSTLPNLSGSAVSFTYDSSWYTAVLESRTDNGGSQFYLTAKQPQLPFYYVCEYSASNCSSANDVRLMNGRCYRAVYEHGLITWYEARNRCLKDGGDLASFSNVTNINFTSWLGSVPEVRFWIGLRFIWYTWGEQGQEMKYTNWDPTNGGKWDIPCVIYCFNCNPTFSWSSKVCLDNMYVVCHTITSFKMTTAATVPTTVMASTAQPVDLSTIMSNVTAEPFPSTEKSAPSNIIPVAVGVGVGVGVPVIAGIIVLTIFIVRKRRHANASSVKSTNRQQAESSIDQSFETPTADERSEIGDNTTYGVVIPSKSPREAEDANEANSPAEQTVYAPLQIL